MNYVSNRLKTIIYVPFFFFEAILLLATPECEEKNTKNVPTRQGHLEKVQIQENWTR